MRDSVYSSERISTFFSPNKLIFGIGTAGLAGTEARRLGASRVLLVTDKRIVAAGVAQGVLASIKAQGIGVSVFDGVQAEPPSSNVEGAARLAREDRCDAVVGIGGGSSMDVAKGASLIARLEGRVLDYAGTDAVPRRGLPKILIPTTAGTGSEVTRVFVVTDETDHLKKPVYSDFVLAETAIVDPGLTVSMPPHVTADTGIDALVHSIETYVSLNATPFSHVLAIEAMRLCGENLPVAYSKSGNMEARFNMSLAATMAGLAFSSGGLGANHALAYVLGTDYHLSHGRSNAVLLPHIVEYNRMASPKKYADIARALGLSTAGLSDYEAGERLVVRLKDLLQFLNVPTRLGAYGILEANIPGLVEGAMKQSRLFAPNPRDLSRDEVSAIYRMAL